LVKQVLIAMYCIDNLVICCCYLLTWTTRCNLLQLLFLTNGSYFY